MIASARALPRDSSRSARANLGPPRMTCPWAATISRNSVSTDSVSSRESDSSWEISAEIASTSDSLR